MLTPQNKMQRYHLDTEGIPEYINALEDSQNQSNRAGNPITNTTLLLIATNTILYTERLPRAEKSGRTSASKRRIGTPRKLCTSQLNRRPSLRSRPLVAKTNLGQRMARSRSILLSPKTPMVRPFR